MRILVIYLTYISRYYCNRTTIRFFVDHESVSIYSADKIIGENSYTNPGTKSGGGYFINNSGVPSNQNICLSNN